MQNGGLSEGRISATKAGLGGMKLAVVQRRIGEGREDKTLEKSAKHGQNAQGPYVVARDGRRIGLWQEKHEGAVPSGGYRTGPNAESEQLGKATSEGGSGECEDEESVYAVDSTRSVFGIRPEQSTDFLRRHHIQQGRE
jgi:hypothetical protein